MTIPTADSLRKKRKTMNDLKTSLAKIIQETFDNGKDKCSIDLSYSDNSPNYFGDNKAEIISILESLGYQLTYHPSTTLSGGFEWYSDYLEVSWEGTHEN